LFQPVEIGSRHDTLEIDNSGTGLSHLSQYMRSQIHQVSQQYEKLANDYLDKMTDPDELPDDELDL
jgi:hypothetical protein